MISTPVSDDNHNDVLLPTVAGNIMARHLDDIRACHPDVIDHHHLPPIKGDGAMRQSSDLQV